MDLFSFLFHKMLTDELEWCELHVDYCDVFISCLDSHSDGTHSLQRIHWWASDVMLNFSKSVLMKKQTHLHLRWPEGEYIFSKFSFLGELKVKVKVKVTFFSSSAYIALNDNYVFARAAAYPILLPEECKMWREIRKLMLQLRHLCT